MTSAISKASPADDPCQENLLSRLDRDLSDHVGMKPAVILNGARRFQHDAVLAIGSDHDIPALVPRRRGVRDNILVVPFDRVADGSRDLRRHVGDLLHRDVDDFGAHRPRHDNSEGSQNGERAKTQPRSSPAHGELFEAGGDLFGVLLVALENFQASGQEVFELLIAG